MTQGERDRAARAAIGPDAAREKGEQLLKACQSESMDAAAMLQLIGEGADPDCLDSCDRSVLMLVSCEESPFDAVVARLIAAGAKLDFVDISGYSALTYASSWSRASTALLLVEAGAALNFLTTGNGITALNFADKEGLAAVSIAIRARGGRTGAELKAHLPPGEQLLWACKRGDAAAALQFINDGADLNCVDERGNSPLILASFSEKLDGVALRLIAAGANLDFVSADGYSAIIAACSAMRVATALLLIEAGAELDHTTKLMGESALDYAYKMDLADLAAAIRARGGHMGAELGAANCLPPPRR